MMEPDVDHGPTGESRVFKADARSRVWRVGDHVLKRFDHSTFKQRWVRRLGRHPAQLERRVNQRLRDAGVAVVPIVAHGIDAGRSWLATPYAGPSLEHWLRDARPGDRARRRQVARATADLLADLLDRGWFFRDFKAANLVVDEASRVWLIDVGSARRATGARHALRMLALLDHTAGDSGATRTDRLAFLRRLIERRPDLGDARTLAARIVALRDATYHAR